MLFTFSGRRKRLGWLFFEEISLEVKTDAIAEAYLNFFDFHNKRDTSDKRTNKNLKRFYVKE